jgi:hypothetical protein
MARALDLERANAAPDRSAEITSVGGSSSGSQPVVTREVPDLRGDRRRRSGPLAGRHSLEAALDRGSALNLGSAPWPG